MFKNSIRSKIIAPLIAVMVIAIGALTVFAAAIVLALTLWFPVFQVQRSSMAPALRDGDVVVFVTPGGVKRGDVVAFYQGNQVLIKRVIALGGDWLDIESDGMVLLNGEPIVEPYVSEPSAGGHRAGQPLQTPDRQFFVMGDHRRTSLDSRNEEIGFVHQNRIIGKARLRIWPPDRLGIVR